MGIFRRPWYQRITPEFVAAPVDVVPDESRIADLDAQISAAWAAGDTTLADRLIDMRNAIRQPEALPSVPVIPGRP